MWTIRKTMVVSAGHCLGLPYESKCNAPHGHNYLVTVEVETNLLNDCSMVADFSHIKAIVMKYDHGDLNEIFAQDGNQNRTTAEALAAAISHDICQELGRLNPSARLKSVTVEETGGALVVFNPSTCS